MRTGPAHVLRMIGLLVLAFVAARAGAQSDGVHAEPARDTPRAAWIAFLSAAEAGHFEQAAEFLDTSHLHSRTREARAKGLARALHAVSIEGGLDRRLPLSELPTGDLDDGLPADEETLGTVTTPLGEVSLVLARLQASRGEPEWRLANRSVVQLPILQRALQRSPLEAYLPTWALRAGLLDAAAWQWAALFLLLPLSWLVAWPFGGLARRTMRSALRGAAEARALGHGDPSATAPPPDTGESTASPLDAAAESVRSPGRLVAALGAWALACQFLGLPADFTWLLGRLQLSLVIAAAAWLVSRIVAASTHVRQARLEAEGRTGAASVLALLRRTGSILIWVVATIAVMQNLGLKVTGVLGALGVGGIAVALAAQKTFENLFGGVALLLDQPVRIGDRCKVGTSIGTVEEVGLRSVRIRTLDRTVLTIPNGQFSEMEIENYGRRDRMRMWFVLGLRYETTSDQLRHVLIELRRILHAHPKVWQEDVHARFAAFGSSSLDIEVLAYIKATAWREFVAIREDLLLHFMDAIAASGTGVAFPSQTTYLARDAGLDRERQAAAEEAVRELRANHALGMPDLSDAEKQSLGGTLAYPPEGSATAPEHPPEGPG